MPILLLPARYSVDTVTLWQAALAAGWSVRRLAYGQAAELATDEQVAIYGEPVFALAVASGLERALLAPPADWLAQLPREFLQRSVQLIRAREVDPAILELPAFIKPAADKLFSAKVYASPDELPDLRTFDPTTPLFVAEPVAWQDEFRCFIHAGQVAAVSVYAREGAVAQAADGSWPCDPDELAEAIAFAQHPVTTPGVSVPPGMVLDIGRIEHKGWAVVEANPAWGAGLYGCEPQPVLEILQSVCRPLSRVAKHERVWVAA